MGHHKRRHRKGYVGCCQMCALRKYDGGLRCKRNPSIQELRSTSTIDGRDVRQEKRRSG
jgi:hypothetical protein